MGKPKLLNNTACLFFIRHCNNEVVCDIVDMNAYHMLLGRPLQFDLNIVHHGKDNTYKFYKDNMKAILASMKSKVKWTYLLVPKDVAEVESMPE